MPNRLLSAVALSGVVVLGVSACSTTAPNPAPAPVKVETIAAPASLSPQAPSADVGYGLVGGSEKLPWIIGGSLADPGKAGTPTVWTSDDGATWTAASVGDAKGSFSGSVAGSDTLAALGGTMWNKGQYDSVLWTSGDGDKWSSVSLPDEFTDGTRLGVFDVDGDVIFGVGSDADGASRGLLVDGDDVSMVTLPKPADDKPLSVQAVVISGDTIVLTATPGAEAGSVATVSYASADRGKSWSKPVEMVDSPGFVSGVTAVDGGFVATGATARDDGAVGLAAWFSADGSSWAAESVPAPPEDGALFTLANADTSLGMPLARGGSVGAVLSNENAAVSGVYARQANGAWSFAAQTSANSTYNAAGVAMPSDSGFVAAIIGPDYARMGVVQGGWSDTTVLSQREFVSNVGEVYPDGDGVQLTLATPTFTVDPDLGWNQSTTSSLAELTDDGVTEVSWDPEAAGTWGGATLATDDSGAQLALGTLFDTAGKTIAVQGSFRSSPDAAWTPITGFEQGGATTLSGARKVGDLWVAYGTVRDSSAISDPAHGAVWTSSDGITWARGSGDFGSGTLESEVSGVCTLPDGALIGVGWTEVEAGEYRTRIWSATDGTWTSSDIGDLGSGPGYATSCTSDTDGVVVAATLDGRDTLQRSTDGTKWTEAFRAERGVSIGEPVAVEGGFAASGSVDGDDYSGPVVWLSTTGAEWTSVAIPSFDAGSTTRVAPAGDDLLVVMSGRIGEPLTVVRNIAEVIKDKA